MLTVSHLSLAFDARPVLVNVTFQLETGQIYGLMGANGSGKTTLFNVLTGFLTPQQGQIHFRGHPLIGKSPSAINCLGLARTFQDLRLIPRLSVLDNVLLAMPHHPTENVLKALLPPFFFAQADKTFREKAERILASVFLAEARHQWAEELSYGQQKLLTLACCLANGASLLLLDEPVAGVNPVYREQIETVILQLKTEGKTILLIEHSPVFLEAVCGSFFFLAQGQVVKFEQFATLKASEAVQRAYLGDK